MTRLGTDISDACPNLKNLLQKASAKDFTYCQQQDHGKIPALFMLNVITSFFQNFNALENILEFWHSDVGYP